MTRFDGIFSSKTDNLTTNSVPHKVSGNVPVPREDIQSANASSDYAGAEAMNQPYPSRDVSTSTVSDARSSVTPARVQRAELSSPATGSEQRVALAQPMPAKTKLRVNVEADPISTGTVRSTWHVSEDSPRVEVKSGQTLSGIAVRYGVPQAEILKANNLKSGADLKYGRTLVIPVKGSAKMKVAAADQMGGEKKKHAPAKMPEQDAAILPKPSTRDKARNGADNLANNDRDNAPTGGYVVREGDSLARIAKANNVSIEQLKKANGMDTASIRIGQKLVIPAGGTDTVKTASIPKESSVKEVSDAKPKAYTPPVAEKSVAEVQKSSDNGEAAPDATGIGKYRWPVRGAVISGYGQNVNGARNTGIDISVPEGTEVKAAENGVVIYSGSGLKDLGNTVLVRHDDGTVTVYGNAESLTVKRGDKVSRGQVIASSGMTGAAERPKLHFEVRKNAVAVNPMTFLQ